MNARLWPLRLISVCTIALFSTVSGGQDPLEPAGAKSKPAKSELDDLVDSGDQGTVFRLVTAEAPHRPLSGLLYWRSVQNVVAAQTAPVEFRLDDAELIAPKTTSGEGEAINVTTYPTEGRAKLTPGKHVIVPGNLSFSVDGGNPTSNHPGLKVVAGKAGPEVLILCAPLRLETVDRRGQPTPSPLRVAVGNRSLLRQEARFSSLVVWLPVGGEYSSTLGTLKLDAAGKLHATQLAGGVQATAAGLRKTEDVPSSTMGAASDVIYVSGGEKRSQYPLYVSPLVKPGEKAWLAVSKRAYQVAIGEAFSFDDFKVRIEPREPQDIAFAPLAADTPGAEQISRAANALGVGADDLAWRSITLPPNAFGPLGLVIDDGQKHSASTSVLVAELGHGIQLVPHRWRTAFAESETATYQVLTSGSSAGGEARIVCQAEGVREVELGRLKLPAVGSGQCDSRLFTLPAGALPAGDYRIWVDAGSQRSPRVPLTVVNWMLHSPFFLHSMSGCTACWPTTDEGLTVLQKAGLDMASATGAWSLLDTKMPRIDNSLAGRVAQAAPGVPAELALRVTANDHLLDRMTRHEMRLIDLTVVREAPLYNEGLSYHHSYAPSVDRMLRRMQLFTQQTGDYASFWGVNYSWFPALGGYVEGGVPCDAHTRDRNEALAKVVEAAGFKPLNQEERTWITQHAASADPAERAQALKHIKQGVDHWRAMHDLGWGKHNQLYNAAIHDVRPETVCTLFENAGHDQGKRTRALFGDMNATCYESYTDYGDWPMSAAFSTDWAHGNYPGKPVWLTTCWGTSPEGMMKSLFHAFARGLEGGGVPLQATNELAELARRGKGLKFISQYGALATEATPDRRVAILSRIAKQVFTPRGMYQQHAIYYHLTRLGYPPVLVSDEDVRGDFPAQVQVLVLAKEDLPFEPALLAAIEKFQARGGKVVSVGQPRQPVAAAIEVDVPLTHLWQMSGFMPKSHQDFWKEFHDHWEEPLAAAMEKAGLAPLALAEVNDGLALAMDAGAVRYVVVLADGDGTHSNDFQRPAGLPVSLAGTGWQVRDLARQQTLPTTLENDRTKTAVNLVTEPSTILALYKSPPAKVELAVQVSPRLGSTLVFQAQVVAADKSNLGGVPIAVTLTGPDGRTRREWFAAAGRPLQASLALHDQSGEWKLTIQELLTGVTAVGSVKMAQAAGAPSAKPIEDVHLVNAAHLDRFVHRAEEKLVIVEPGQQAFLPIAEKLTADLNADGVKARLWQVRPEEFDTQPVRWYPRPDDAARLEAIKAGRLIGYRENLQPYIDKLKRAHVPELGGYAEIQPPYIVGQDCIVFAGGKLCESLRAVTPWINTPNVPGRGQGRLVVCFSPFMADRQATAVLANDERGLAKAAEKLASLYDRPSAEPNGTNEPYYPLVIVATKSEVRPVAQPYRNYSPEDRVRRLYASRTGQAAVLLNGQQDDLAFLDAQGKVTATVRLPDTLVKTHLTLDDAGRLNGLDRTILAKDASWGFATAVTFDLVSIGSDGKRAWRMPAYSGDAGLAPDHQAGFRVAGDGSTMALTRASALLLGQRGAPGWRRYDELPHVARRFEVLYPRTAVGTTFSTDNRYVLGTFDSRPPFGNMGQGLYQPSSAETVLLDVQSGQRVWALRDPDYRKATYAAHSGFAAVAADGALVALAGFDGAIMLIDKSGKVAAQEEILPSDQTPGRIGPPEGVGVWMSDRGETAAFGFKNLLVIARENRFEKLPLQGLVSACVSPEGSLVVAALRGGEVQAFDAQANVKWSISSGGSGSYVAAASSQGFLVASSDGSVTLLDPSGVKVWQTNVAQAADVGTHALADVADFVQLPAVPDYTEPETLAYAQRSLGAQQVNDWKPLGTSQDRFGRKFYMATGPIEVAASSSDGDYLLHLVYRRPEENKSLKVALVGRDGQQTFELDLATPEYRVVDLPLRGAGAKARITSDGPVEIAECSLWSLKWPGANLAYVKPAGASFDSKVKPAAGNADDILAELDNKPQQATGQMKDCKIYYPNSDVDRVKGPYLRAPVDPTLMVDGRRFEAAIPAWAARSGMYKPTRGAFFTIDFAQPSPLGLVATYDRVAKQSEVCQSLVVFTGEEVDEATSGKVLKGVTYNDQFWRLFPLGNAKLRVLGVHAFSGATSAVGLSEVEAYK